jgi:uridine kinase
VIGVAGGSGSGKTTICASIVEQIGPDHVALIAHDAYYRHRPELSYEERTRVNYDHPDSLETELLTSHVTDLAAGQPIHQPVYDFSRHLRRPETMVVEPRPVVLIEGILILVEPELRRVMDLQVFVDTDPDVRVLRRVERDMRERGRSFDSIVRQYLATVRPMHLQFVEPSKRYADVIIPEGYNRDAVGALVSTIREVLGRSAPV